jgi:hypothetical protein
MESNTERRQKNRIRYSWPAWFGYEENGEFCQGQVVDLSRTSVGLTVASDRSPEMGDHVLARFSYPIHGSCEFQMDTYYQWTQVIRLASTATGMTHVALKLAHPLNQDPTETLESANLMQSA